MLVLSESSSFDPKLDDVYRDVVPMASYDNLGKLADEWLQKDKNELIAYRKKGYDFIRAQHADLELMRAANQFTIDCIDELCHTSHITPKENEHKVLEDQVAERDEMRSD